MIAESNKKLTKNTKKKIPLFKVVTVGDSEVGKTTLLNTFIVKINKNKLE
jgi:GTPase SAR1 family protein